MCDFSDNTDNEINVSDADIKQSQIASTSSPEPPKNIDFSEDQVDIRPRFKDPVTGNYFLLDCGSQASICPADPDDVVDTRVHLEAVQGSPIASYGTKEITFRMGRKTYTKTFIKTNIQEFILGMDFIKPNKIELRWREFGDYYAYDKIAQIHTLLEFVKTKNL